MADMTIAEQVGEMGRESAAEPPNPVMMALADEQAGLARAGQPEGVATAGDVLPDSEMQGADGSPQSLSAAVGEGLAVLILYRGAWCPYCNIALRTYQAELLPALRARGVPLVAISPQAPDGSLTMREKHELAFAVLSDPGNSLARAAGVLTGPTAEARAAQLDLGVDLESVNADSTTGLPMPTTVIVDSALTIRWIDVHPDYSTRSEPAEILAALDRVVGQA